MVGFLRNRWPNSIGKRNRSNKLLKNQHLALTTGKPRHILVVSASMLACLQHMVEPSPGKGGRNEEEEISDGPGAS